jgi:hypothetical protein
VEVRTLGIVLPEGVFDYTGADEANTHRFHRFRTVRASLLHYRVRMDPLVTG